VKYNRTDLHSLNFLPRCACGLILE